MYYSAPTYRKGLAPHGHAGYGVIVGWVPKKSRLAKCEKMLRTPIPLGYTRYTVRFLWIWLTLLPFALVRTFKDFGAGTWWEDKPQPVLVLAMFFIGFIFLSIEDIAVQIEEPFAILPLELHQKYLEKDVEQATQLMDFEKRRRARQPKEQPEERSGREKALSWRFRS